jgi:hypothetical protein
LETLSTSSAVFSTSLEVLSASSEVLLAKFLFGNFSALISATLHRQRHRTRLISEDFWFGFLKLRSLIFGKPKPETCQSTVLLGRSATFRLHQLVRPIITGRCVTFTRSRVDLTRGGVTHTRRRVVRVPQRVQHPSDPHQCRRQFLRVSVVLRQPSPARVFHAPVFGFRPPAFLRLFTVFLRFLHCWCCCLTFSVAFIYFFFPLSSLYCVLSFEFLFFFSVILKVPSAVCIYLLCKVWEGFWNLLGFSILLDSSGRYLVVLGTFCLGCLWVLAFIWFLAVPTLQLLLHCDSCLPRIELLTEFLCVSNRLARSWNRPGLPLILFELWVNTIASCSVLLDRIQNCSYFSTVIYHLGYVVGAPTPFLFFGSPTSSSVRIRSGKDPPL